MKHSTVRGTSDTYVTPLFSGKGYNINPETDIIGYYSLLEYKGYVLFVHVSEYLKENSQTLYYEDEMNFLKEYETEERSTLPLPEVIPLFLDHQAYAMHVCFTGISVNVMNSVIKGNHEVTVNGKLDEQKFTHIMKYTDRFEVKESHSDSLKNYILNEDVKGMYGLLWHEGYVCYVGEIEFLKPYEHPGLIISFGDSVIRDCFSQEGIEQAPSLDITRVIIDDPYNPYRIYTNCIGKADKELVTKVIEEHPVLHATLLETDDTEYEVELKYSDQFRIVCV